MAASLDHRTQQMDGPPACRTENLCLKRSYSHAKRPLGTGFDTHRPVWAHSRVIGAFSHNDTLGSCMVRSKLQGTLSCRPILDTDPEHPRDTLFFMCGISHPESPRKSRETGESDETIYEEIPSNSVFGGFRVGVWSQTAQRKGLSIGAKCSTPRGSGEVSP